jgi:hypothetical protein
MELSCALLTGFFWWLFLYHWHHSKLARARDVAGPLLIEIRAPESVVRKARWQCRFYFARFLPLLVVWWIFSALSDKSLPLDFLVAVLTCALLHTVFPPYRTDASLELRAKGVLRREQIEDGRPLELTFTPWEEISQCNWYGRMPEYCLHTKHLALETAGLLPDEIAAVTAVAGRFVPVYDSKGKPLAEPESRKTRTEADSRTESGGSLKFQFDLKSLFLLTLVVSCAASCWGIHSRRPRPQEILAAKLSKFHPQIHCHGDDVYRVDFTTCAVKPGDDDLKRLQELELTVLDLDGSPISDAGLQYLYEIRTLREVSLLNTKVTQTGVEELKQHLLNADIRWSATPLPHYCSPAAKEK